MRFQVLGPVAAYGERGPVALGPARQRTLLGALLIEPGTAVGVAQLLERVWGDARPRRARETMHSYLSRLRTVLGDAQGPPLVRRSASYVLEVAPEAVDLHQFRAMVRHARQVTDDAHGAVLWRDALALWQGVPYADSDSDWARGIATALEAERQAAVLDRNDVLLRSGEHARLLPELAADAAARPLDERLAGQLMLALYHSGRQADALAYYRSLRERLAEELGSDPGPELRELHQQLLRQEPRLTVSATPGATAPAAAPDAAEPSGAPPAQLPADVPGFTGRAEPLRRLDLLLGPADAPPSTVVITALGGAAGIGKTALAVHWAHRVRDRFPDGQLYLNLRGFDPGGQVMTPAEALRSLLELLDVPPAQIPAGIDAQAGLYRTRLTGTRTLVVLDNARDVDQVRPLIPGSPGTMVLATSRDQLAGLAVNEGAHLVRLDVLSDQEARRLLVHRLGAGRVAAEPEAVDGIVTACAGLPLALAIVAARAATRPTFPLSAFADELTDARGRLDALSSPEVAVDVRAVFSWSYQALGTEAARMFRLLGLHPGPDLGLGAAANLAAVPVPYARRLLAELTSAHLITERTPGRYVFHDLLRAYATELADAVDPAPNRHAASHRMYDHYVHSAHAADQWLPIDREAITLSPPQPQVVPDTFAGNAAAREWFATELPVLLALTEHTGDGDLDLQIQQLVRVIGSYLTWRGMWHHKIAVQRAGLHAARRRADRPAQAYLHRGLAHACERLERRDDARSHIHQSRQLYREIGDHVGQARTLLTLVWLSERDGRYRDGLGYARQCLQAALAGGNRVLQALARNAIGWCHTLLGEHDQAIVQCRQALAELRDLAEPVSIGDVLNSLGRAHSHLGQHPEAIDYYRQCVDWHLEHGNRPQEAVNLVRLGEAHHRAGENNSAREAWQHALAIFDETGHPDADRVRARIVALA